MKRIITAGLLALSLAACGSTDTPEPANTEATATPTAEAQGEELRDEALSVLDDMSMYAHNAVDAAEAYDYTKVCIRIWPKLEAKADHLEGLMVKMDEVEIEDIDMTDMREQQSDIAGLISTVDSVCSSAGL